MTTQRSIRVVVVPVGQEPEVRELPSEGFGRALESVVGGCFERHSLDEAEDGGGINAYVNEMGMADGLLRACWVPGQFLHGPVVVARSDSDGKPVDLTDDDLMIYTNLLGRRFQAWNYGVLFEGDDPRARVLEISLNEAPRLVWIPIEGGGRITAGIHTLVDGVYAAHPLVEDADGGGLDMHVNCQAKESGLAKNLCVDGRWLHGDVVVGRRHPQVGFVDMTDADLATCAARFGVDLSGLMPRDPMAVRVIPMESGEP